MPLANETLLEKPRPTSPVRLNKIHATRVIIATLGCLLALGGLDHGFFETLQGNAPTGSLFIRSIGARQQMWVYGTEDAFTLVPYFLLSGIVSITLSLLIAVWSIAFVHRKHGSTVFVLLSILLFLSGGGVAQVIFFLIAWAVSTRIHKPVRWVQRLTPEWARHAFGKFWPACLIAFSALALAALEIAIFGYVPGVHSAELALHICWSLLGIGLSILLLGIASGFVHDATQDE
jgi:hypothetical protein